MDIASLIAPVITSIITGFVTFAGVLVTNGKTQAVIAERLDNYKTHTDMRIDSLTKHVEKHNGVVERTYKLESDVATAFHRLDEMRDDIREIRDKVT